MSGIWMCIRCHTEISVAKADPAIDSFGIYFICPYCRRRNQLVYAGRKRGVLLLMQTGK